MSFRLSVGWGSCVSAMTGSVREVDKTFFAWLTPTDELYGNDIWMAYFSVMCEDTVGIKFRACTDSWPTCSGAVPLCGCDCILYTKVCKSDMPPTVPDDPVAICNFGPIICPAGDTICNRCCWYKSIMCGVIFPDVRSLDAITNLGWQSGRKPYRGIPTLPFPDGEPKQNVKHSQNKK